MHSRPRSVALVLTMATTGLALTAAPALAFAPAPAAAVVSAVNPSVIDPNATTTLSIHKYLGAPTGQAANGTAQTVSLPPVQGIVFDVYQVMAPDGKPIDLSTNAGWVAATALQDYKLTSTDITRGSLVVGGTTYPLTKKPAVTTDATGLATYTQTGPGLFLVNENLAASTSISSGGKPIPASSITPSAPFLVTLPMTSPTGDSWLYQVHAYPKNASDSVTKTVTDATATQGGVSTSMGGALVPTADTRLDYTLTGTITPGLTAAQMGAYAIADQLPRGASYDSVRVTAGTTDLIAGTDYKVYVNGAVTTGASTLDGPMVQIAMTPAGLAKLEAAKKSDPAATVVAKMVVIATTTSGVLSNTATLIPNNAYWQSVTKDPTATYNPDASVPGGGDTPTQDKTTTGGTTPVTTTNPSNVAQTHFGRATITKTDAKAGTTLQGAKFDLYSKIVPLAAVGTYTAKDCSSVVTDDTLKVMTGVTTGAAGTVDITGLQKSDFYNNAAQPAADGRYILYCLVETQAPAGYNLNAEPTAFTVTKTDAAMAVSVQDEKTNLANNLPLTGGAGAGALSLAGLVVVGGTLAARAASRKRRDAAMEDELV